MKQINLTKITGESLYNPIRVPIMKKQQNLNKLLMDEVFYLPVHLNIFHEVNPVDNVY